MDAAAGRARGGVLDRVVVVSIALRILALAVPLLPGFVVDRVVPCGDAELLLAVGGGLLVVVAMADAVAVPCPR